MLVSSQTFIRGHEDWYLTNESLGLIGFISLLSGVSPIYRWVRTYHHCRQPYRYVQNEGIRSTVAPKWPCCDEVLIVHKILGSSIFAEVKPMANVRIRVDPKQNNQFDEPVSCKMTHLFSLGLLVIHSCFWDGLKPIYRLLPVNLSETRLPELDCRKNPYPTFGGFLK